MTKKKDGQGADWLRAQAQQQKAAARQRNERKMADAKKQAESLGDAFHKLVDTVRTQQSRLTRLANFAAEQTLHIVEYRRNWRTEYERAEDLDRKLADALRQLQNHVGGKLVWAYANDHMEGTWATLTANHDEPQLSIKALTEVGPVVPLVHPNGEVTEGLGQQGPVVSFPPGDQGTTAKQIKKRAAAKRPAKKAAPKKGARDGARTDE